MLIKNFGSQIKMPTTLGVSEIIRKLEIIKGYILIGGRIFSNWNDAVRTKTNCFWVEVIEWPIKRTTVNHFLKIWLQYLIHSVKILAIRKPRVWVIEKFDLIHVNGFEIGIPYLIHTLIQFRKVPVIFAIFSWCRFGQVWLRVYLKMLKAICSDTGGLKF